jgi:hypothetical protein
MLRYLRLLAVAVGVGLSIGETIRSWGAHRPIFAVVDDYVMAVFLVAAAIWGNRPGTYGFLSAAFGFSSGRALRWLFAGLPDSPRRSSLFENHDLSFSAIFVVPMLTVAPARRADRGEGSRRSLHGCHLHELARVHAGEARGHRHAVGLGLPARHQAAGPKPPVRGRAPCASEPSPLRPPSTCPARICSSLLGPTCAAT